MIGAALLGAAADAQTLRWASRADVESMDPHTIAETHTLGVAMLAYEGLVLRDRNQRIVPGLSVGWQRLSPTRWRFDLRRGVTFHDGSRFTADDVVFSILRAQHPASQMSYYAVPLGTPVKLDDYTIELHQQRVNPILLDHLASILIMSRSWAYAHGAAQVPNYAARQEAYSTRHAMGTGQYVLARREPGVRTEYEINPKWWGLAEGNVLKIVYTPIGNDSTRTAALIAGDVNFVNDIPMQDIERVRAQTGLRLSVAPESRLIFLGFDQWRDELLHASVKGRNPFKDARVREAFAYAIDVQAIKARIMRGFAVPARCMAVVQVGCIAAEIDAPLALDLTRARRLMSEAGYGEGFDLTIDCPSDRYQNDRAICVALVGMLARINVRLQVDARPKSLFFPKVQSGDTSFYMLGWAGSYADAQPVLDPLVHSLDPSRGMGGSNYGRISDPLLDRLIEEAGSQPDVDRRRESITAAQRRIAETFVYLPLHRQTLLWASRMEVQTPMTPNGVVRVGWFQIGPG